ncbi:MAG: metallophosphoesterase [Anaerolineae bacterium]|nr:metallophosphoesterase [Anaerolineae bacterium]
MTRKNSALHVLTLVALVLSLMGLVLAGPAQAAEITFTGTELLSRPTANSVSVTIVPDAAILLYYEYGTTSGVYTEQTATTTATAGTPKTVVIGDLTANTDYYYRMRYSTDAGANWETRPEYSFHTARAAGNTFTFTITSDSHVNIVMGSATTWTNTCNDVAADDPDFHIDLGDTVAMRSVDPGDVAGAEAAYEYQLPFFNIFSASSPVFLVPGNHEQKEGWHVDGTPNDTGPPEDSLPVIGTNAQKKYFPMPFPDAFYTGDSSTLSYLDGDQLRENYYAWAWGDALFVVIDPFWYTTTKPYVNDIGGGETNGTGSGDAWSWTLGQTQFDWLKTTLTNSTAAYKFVFTHQLLTDASLTSQEDYGHAGANHAHMVEWGGNNEAPDDSTWAWDTRRAGWGSDPIHDMMVDAGVSAVFHGHDHQYAYEQRDGVVYQAIPAAGWGSGGSGFGMYTTDDGYTIQALSNCGHLRVTVGPSETTVEYLRTGQTTSSNTYTIEPSEAPVGVLGEVSGDGFVNSTDALVILSCDVGLNTSSLCPMNCGDVNSDGVVNSTDALVILSYDAGMSVPFPVGQPGCPSSVTPCAGCGP